MRRSLLTITALFAFSSACLADDIPVDRVILSTSGLAHFEHRASVEGDGKVEFPVRLEQVDDILKSLVVFDEKGRLGGVTLPGKQPLAQAFKDLPFTQAQLANPMLLLNAYQGATVTVKTKDGTLTGKLLHVTAEQVVHDDNKTETRHRISLMTAEGLKQAILEEAISLQFEDEKIRADIARALQAIRENGTAEQRVLTVSLLGDGKRDVALSYVVDAPLWKAAYRMVVPEAGAEKGLLQGWAVIENMTASDWSKVDLTLVSGNPVTFRQSLYQSYYVDRPEIPVQVFGRVMPRKDEGVVSTAAQMEGSAAQERTGALQKAKGMRREAVPMAAPMESMAFADSAAIGGVAGSPPMPAPMPAMAGEARMQGMDMVANAASAAQSAEATTQVLFRFPDRFDLKAGQSMMLPFVSREVPMERVSVYQPETHARHPLAAVEMKNDGDSGLPPGVLTLYEESGLLKGTAFVGDAQLPVVAAGEKRLVPYALDSKTTVDREDKSSSSEGKVSISEGILNVSVLVRNETVYTVKAPEKEARTVVLEHPKMPDYKLVTPDPEEVEVTEDRYRIRVALKKGESRTLPVVLENTVWQSYGLDGMATDQLLAYAGGQGGLDADTRRKFEALAAIRREMDALDQKDYALQAERDTIFQDQERVRENLKSLDGKSDVQDKYMKKLEAQEDRIAEIDGARKKLAQERQEKESALRKLIAEMKF